MRDLITIIETHEDDHAEALQRTGFWGKAAAGCLFVATSTRRLLFPLRSRAVEQPHTWGCWGGALDGRETPVQGVRREISEEAGYHGEYELIPLYVFKKGTFSYHNFLAVVEDEFKPQLNWESEKFIWTTLDDLPSPLHFGVTTLLNDPASLKIIENYTNLR